MSGVFGIFYLSGRAVDPEILSRGASIMSHRGPDGVHTWQSENLGFGHCELSISSSSKIDEQPYQQSETGLVIVSDARIDNWDEFSTKLFKDAPFGCHLSDAAIILQAYRKWGRDCLQHLEGDFAFCIWDSAKQQLFLARDHIGTRPLYYFHSRELFAFASEIKVLLGLSEVSRRVNDRRIVEHLTGLEGDKESTFYRDISRLPPASWLVVSRQDARVQTYWRLADAPDIRFSTDKAYANALLELLSTAVSRRLRSSHPVGLALSGGLDSTSIVCLAEEILSKRSKQAAAHTFSAVFPDLPVALRPQVDEGDYIQKVLPHLSFANHQINVSAAGPLANSRTILSILDEPYFAPTLEIFWALYEEAATSGCRVYLEGFDGDATISHGLERLPEMLLKFQWRTLLSEIDAFRRRHGDDISQPKIIKRFALGPALRYLLHAALPSGKRAYSPGRPRQLDFLRADVRSQYQQDEPDQDISPLFGINFSRQMHSNQLTSADIPRGLEITNHLASYHGLEARFPFFDRKLMEYCVGVPVEQKLSGGWTRVYFRRALIGVVPEETRLRSNKANFDVYFSHMMSVHETHHLDDITTSVAKPVFDYIDRDKFRKSLEIYYNNPSRRITEAEEMYTVLTLSSWLDGISG